MENYSEIPPSWVWAWIVLAFIAVSVAYNIGKLLSKRYGLSKNKGLILIAVPTALLTMALYLLGCEAFHQSVFTDPANWILLTFALGAILFGSLLGEQRIEIEFSE